MFARPLETVVRLPYTAGMDRKPRRSVVRMTYNRQLNGVVLVVNGVAIVSDTFGAR